MWHIFWSIPFLLFSLNIATWDSTPNSTTAKWVSFGIALLIIYSVFTGEDFKRYRRNIAARKQADIEHERANQRLQVAIKEHEDQLERLRSYHAALPTPQEYATKAQTKALQGFTIADPLAYQRTQQYAEYYREYFVTAKNMGQHFVTTQGNGYLAYLNMETALDIPQQTRFAGTWIVAPPGRGKTNLLHNLIMGDRPRGTVVLMDSKGDLINAYRGLPDVVVIEPSTVQINPFQLGSSTRTLDFLEYIFSALLETKMTPKQTTLFRCVLALMLKIPNATVETFRKVLVHGWKDYDAYVMQLDESNRDFFFVEGRKSEFDGGQYNETKQEVLQRLRLLVSNDYLKQIFTAPRSNISFFDLLDSRKTVIIDNSKDELGENGAEFFGRFFVAMVWMAAVSRSRQKQEDKVPVYFYIDECHTVIKRDTKITTILDECRSQKIALVLAHQRVAQIEPNVIDALNNCAIRLANSDDDAESLAKRFRVEAAALRLPIGQFSCFVRDKTAQAVTINIPLFDTSQFPPPPPRSVLEPVSSAPEPPIVRAQPRIVPTDEVEDF